MTELYQMLSRLVGWRGGNFFKGALAEVGFSASTLCAERAMTEGGRCAWNLSSIPISRVLLPSEEQ